MLQAADARPAISNQPLIRPPNRTQRAFAHRAVLNSLPNRTQRTTPHRAVLSSPPNRTQRAFAHRAVLNSVPNRTQRTTPRRAVLNSPPNRTQRAIGHNTVIGSLPNRTQRSIAHQAVLNSLRSRYSVYEVSVAQSVRNRAAARQELEGRRSLSVNSENPNPSRRLPGASRPTNPRTSTESTMTTVNSHLTYESFHRNASMQEVSRRSMIVRPNQTAPPARRLRRNSLTSESDSSNSAVESSTESNHLRNQNPRDSASSSWRNWWCNSCRRPREECECICVIS